MSNDYSPAAIADWARAIAERYGASPESAEYLNHVARWRSFWRPERVRVLLVAESHVAELPADASVRVSMPRDILSTYPEGYCRLVYCLGYGEDAVCAPRPSANGGTWQYWDLLGQIAGGPGHVQPRRRDAAVERRLAWKVDVLDRLRARGVWLVDAAVTAFYTPGGRRPFRGSAYRSALRESWSRFVWPSVMDEPIESIWMIGRGVADALADKAELRGCGVISQPQDRNVHRYQQELLGMVSALSGTADLP